jgi:hypothetical protein
MKRYTQTYLISRKSSTLNRKVNKGSRLFLNDILLQHGFDYELRKRNVKFTEPLEYGDVIVIEEVE